MRSAFIRLIGIPVILSLACALPAQDLRDLRFIERAGTGFAAIFNFDYDEAGKVFASLEEEYPHHPAPPLYLASILWLEEMSRRQDLSLNRFLYPTYFSGKTEHVMPPSERAVFFEHLRQCEARANAILHKNRNDRDSRYFLATAYGLRSSFTITIDHSLRSAFSNGTKAYSIMRQLIREDPDYHDACLTVGIYEYIVGSTPWYLKWMAFVIRAHGSKQDGLKHLKLASEKGPYVKNEARLVHMVLNVREHRYAEALEIARDLTAQFPRNFLFPLCAAQISRLAGQRDQAAALFLQVEKRVEAGEPNFDQISVPTFRYNLGSELMDMGKLEPAEERFRRSIEDPRTPEREKALSHLRLGRILEWRAKLDEAVKEYRIVLALKNIENSHGQAKQYLRKLAGK